MTFRRTLITGLLLIFLELIFVGASLTWGASTQLQDKQPLQERVLISQYDPLMKDVADELDLDWRLLAAIGYHESRFNNEVKSNRGAVGVMQVMPRIAKNFGADGAQIKDPMVNILVAGKLLKEIESSLKLKNVEPREKMKIVLACYNAGIGHVSDARRLAAKHGANYNSWNELSKYLLIKGTEMYVNDSAVRSGAFKGNQTVAFVNNVINKYDKYCMKTLL